ncbi:MAG: imidazoleglycerol-phosphate dehydratase HisB [Armatimonadota bacterium]|nr:imidazoleglycerol-phosphate dehydratase HisB [Armatimonadota bacterium]
MSITTERDRIGQVHRVTRETDVTVRIDLDGPINSECRTGVPFLDHMLDQVAHHGRMDLQIAARGDVEIDDHHTVEDVGITLGQAIAAAAGDKSGIRRAASFMMPMDDALVLVALDLSGRPFLEFNLDLRERRVGLFDGELVVEFFRALAVNAGMTLHIRQMAGQNAHHIIEAAFKAFARALDEATQRDERISGVPSTKGIL